MSTTVESLELQIQSSSSQAISGIDALSSSLSRLKTATKGGFGLSRVSNQIRNLNSSLQGMDNSATAKIDTLANSLQKLSNLGKLKISASIGNQLKNIGTAANSLRGADFSGIAKLSQAITPLNNIDKSAGLNSTIKQLNKLPQLAQTLNGINWDKLTHQLRRLSDALSPLASGLNTVSTAFTRLPANIRRTVAGTNRLANVNQRAATSYINLWAKFRIAMNVVRTGARVIASFITQSNAYIENLNLFNASMGEYAREAQNYAEKVGELMGIDPSEWMRNQGVFMTITEGFGVASDRAYVMSKNLTQLGYDLSSFFNISYADSMQKLTSGISGELEPLRRLGYDLSQARLQSIALSLGVDKSFHSMTQAEKAQLRYYAVMTQVTKAQGDMARTLQAPANQLRILHAQVIQLARALGNIFIPLLTNVLPYIIAFAKALRLAAAAIASFFGFELPEIDYSGLKTGAAAVGDMAHGADNAGSGLGKAAKKAKELKNALLGIDELHVISKNENNGGSGAGIGGVGGLGGNLGFELPEYDFMGNLINSKVNEILQSMKEWLGLTGEINSWSDFFHTRLGKILSTITAIGLGLIAWKISKSFIRGLERIKQLQSLGLDKVMAMTIGISLVVTGVTLEAFGIKDAIENELDKLNFAQILAGGTSITLGGAFIGKALGSTLIGAAGGAVLAGVPAFITGIYLSIRDGIDWLTASLTVAGSTAAGAGIGAIIGSLGGPIGAGIGALIGLAVGLITDGIILICQHWDEITNFLSEFFTVTIPNLWNDFASWVSGLPEELGKFFSGLPDRVSQWFDELWQPIKDYDWYGLGRDMGLWLGKAAKNAFDFVTTRIPNWLGETYTAIKNSLWKFFVQTLPAFFTKTLPFALKVVFDFITFVPKKLYELFIKGAQWFVDMGAAIVNGLLEGLASIWEALKEWCSGVVDGIKEAFGINSPSTVFIEIGGFLVDGLLQGLAAPFVSIGNWVGDNIIDPISNAIRNNPVSDIVVGIANTASNWWDSATKWWNDITGNNNISVESAVRLVKKGWTTVKDWIGHIPTLSQAVNLVKKAWTTVKGWIGNIPVLSQGITLAKRAWTTVKNWIGNMPTLSQTISLVKSSWNTVRGWIGRLPIIGQGVSLIKSGWNTVKGWMNTPTVSVGLSLFRSGWNSLSSWVGNKVSVGISLVKSGWESLKSFFGLSGGGIVGANGGVRAFERGGIINSKGQMSFWNSIPKYAGGTNNAHGSMFVAGENGAEMVGHINGRTEVLNRFQLGAVMHRSIVDGMAQFTGYWRNMTSQMTTCTNAIIRTILFSTDVMNSNFATATAYNTNALVHMVYEDTKNAYGDEKSSESFSKSIKEFYSEYVEPTLREIAADTKRQAYKDDTTIVQIGNRTITDAVTTQEKANGFNFTW